MLAKLLGRARFLDADLEDWCFDTWGWLTRNLDAPEATNGSVWVTPTPEFFPKTEAAGVHRGQHVFDCVKRAMGMEEWPCHLRPYERMPRHARVAEFVHLETPEEPNGVFWMEGGEAIIEYAADLIERPMQLTATLAHELCHYLLATVEEPAPGGEVAHELATELCVTFTGMGLFAANTAFEFSQHGDAFSQGWQSSRSGYLSERAWAFSLGLFGTLHNEPAPERWLKPGLVTMTRAAERYLAKRPDRLDSIGRPSRP